MRMQASTGSAIAESATLEKVRSGGPAAAAVPRPRARLVSALHAAAADVSSASHLSPIHYGFHSSFDQRSEMEKEERQIEKTRTTDNKDERVPVGINYPYQWALPSRVIKNG